MEPVKCPDCGVWWRGMEHRCPPPQGVLTIGPTIEPYTTTTGITSTWTAVYSGYFDFIACGRCWGFHAPGDCPKDRTTTMGVKS